MFLTLIIQSVRLLTVRKASDLPSTSRLLIAIVTIIRNAGDWSLLNDQVLLLSKKHGQLKQATTKMVQVVMGYLDETPNMDVKLSVIETLRTVTDGKVGSCAWPAALLLTMPDIRRSRTGSCHPHLIEYQKVPRRPQCCRRHPLRTAGGDVWFDD